MPFIVQDMSEDPNWDVGNAPGGPGGGGVPGGSGTPSAPDTAFANTSGWFDVRWTYAEPTPAGACTGFEVAIFASATPQTESTWVMLEPIASVAGAAERRYATRVSLRMSVPFYAAVRAVYGDFKSAWAVLGSPVTFQPDAIGTADDDAPGYRRMEDGTIMQWMTVPARNEPQWTNEQSYTVNWPTPFPQACQCAVVTTRTDSPNNSNDIAFQLVSKSPTSITLYRQIAPGTAGAGNPARAHIVAWGI